ncbi:hypothetical protein C8J57DRAFT_1228592 [Mycena rebaudengoi]|nr:hypothetical protein C8J57DRAFT_1228592 [Mycena rebaudengoi]
MMISGWTRLEKNESKNKFLGLVIPVEPNCTLIGPSCFVQRGHAPSPQALESGEDEQAEILRLVGKKKKRSSWEFHLVRYLHAGEYGPGRGSCSTPHSFWLLTRNLTGEKRQEGARFTSLDFFHCVQIFLFSMKHGRKAQGFFSRKDSAIVTSGPDSSCTYPGAGWYEEGRKAHDRPQTICMYLRGANAMELTWTRPEWEEQGRKAHGVRWVLLDPSLEHKPEGPRSTRGPAIPCPAVDFLFFYFSDGVSACCRPDSSCIYPGPVWQEEGRKAHGANINPNPGGRVILPVSILEPGGRRKAGRRTIFYFSDGVSACCSQSSTNRVFSPKDSAIVTGLLVDEGANSKSPPFLFHSGTIRAVLSHQPQRERKIRLMDVRIIKDICINRRTDLDSHPWPVDDARSPPPRADTKRRRAGAEHAASDSGIGLDARGLRSAVCPRARSVRERAAGRLRAEPRDSEGVSGCRRAASDSGISLAAVAYARCGQAARARHVRERALGPRREEDAVPAPHASPNRTHNTTTPSNRGRAWWAQDAGVGRQRIAEEHISRAGTQRRLSQRRRTRGRCGLIPLHTDPPTQTPFATPWQWDQTRKGSVLNVRERALEPWWCTGTVAARGWCARQLWTRGHRDDCDATTASIEIQGGWDRAPRKATLPI